MSYLPVDDENILKDINLRKEFKILANEHSYTPDDNILPFFMISKELSNGRFLRLRSYQLFVSNFMNPDTPYTRLMIKHDMGTGKTISGLSIAMRFISYFKKIPQTEKQCYVYIIGFTRSQFERDLLRFPGFGFVTELELQHLSSLRKYSQIGSEIEKNIYKEYLSKIRKRVGNGKGNGFFKFIGFRELSNRIFVSNKDVSKMSNVDVMNAIKNGDILIDLEYVSKFKNCLLMFDEIHNVYNTTENNNWGSAIQIILNHFGKDIRAVFLSGTILKNSPTEITNVLNLIAGSKDKTYNNEDFFTTSGELLPSALNDIAKASYGKISFLVDINPQRYPSSSYVGEKLENSKYISFVRTAMPELQFNTYMSIIDDKTSLHEHSYVFDMVFPPLTGKIGLYKSSQLKILQNASDKWKSDNGINIDRDNVIKGNILHADNLIKFSSKYPKMLDILTEARTENRCKTFIYHKFVQMTGVMLIGEILSSNGYISLNSSVSNNTQCALCKYTFETHPADTHPFTAARYIVITGSMNKNTITDLLDSFNNIDNINGDNIMIIVGSRIMRESYDLIGVRNEIILSRPDNIPSLLQITARAIRSGSHQNLPGDKQNVKIYILTSMAPNGDLSYEEKKYIQKIKDYVVIQNIERSLHTNALDNLINRGIIEKSLVKDAIGNLYYEPGIKIDENIKPADLNLSSFNVYYRENEVSDMIYIIKRHFMEHSPVWNEEDLWKSVRNPPFSFGYDTSMFSKESFDIAMVRLVWEKDKLHYTNVPYLMEVLYDSSDKRIIINNKINGIIHIGSYYICFPINQITNTPEKYIDSIFRNKNNKKNFDIDINIYTKTSLSINRYITLKTNFITAYKDKPIIQMSDVICINGLDFHIMLVEEVISYVFDFWTDVKKMPSNEYNDFYFQMLYFYDIMGFIIWIDDAKDYIHDLYDDYKDIILQDKASYKNLNIPDKSHNKVDRRRLTSLVRAIERSGCSWCPNATQSRYNKSLLKSKQKSNEKGAKINNTTSDMVPIGHNISDIPRFYHPKKGWFSTPEYMEDNKEWVENPIIIGFDTRSEGGTHIRFKLRNPKQKIQHHADARLIERGIICTSRSRPYLLSLCKKLNIKKTNDKANISSICNEIRAAIIYNELQERSKGSNIKWYYNQFEKSS